MGTIKKKKKSEDALAKRLQAERKHDVERDAASRIQRTWRDSSKPTSDREDKASAADGGRFRPAPLDFSDEDDRSKDKKERRSRHTPKGKKNDDVSDTDRSDMGKNRRTPKSGRDPNADDGHEERRSRKEKKEKKE